MIKAFWKFINFASENFLSILAISMFIKSFVDKPTEAKHYDVLLGFIVFILAKVIETAKEMEQLKGNVRLLCTAIIRFCDTMEKD